MFICDKLYLRVSLWLAAVNCTSSRVLNLYVHLMSCKANNLKANSVYFWQLNSVVSLFRSALVLLLFSPLTLTLSHFLLERHDFSILRDQLFFFKWSPQCCSVLLSQRMVLCQTVLLSETVLLCQTVLLLNEPSSRLLLLISLSRTACQVLDRDLVDVVEEDAEEDCRVRGAGLLAGLIGGLPKHGLEYWVLGKGEFSRCNFFWGWVRSTAGFGRVKK